MIPTKEQIEEELTKLKALLPVIRPCSVFGTDNKAQLAAQIKVLENRWDIDDVYNEYDHAGIDEETISAALGAVHWLEGVYDVDTLSDDWEGLRTGPSA